jgi:electron transfer flavoprotein alpha subunit
MSSEPAAIQTQVVVLVIAETRDNRATPLTRELLGLAQAFAHQPAGIVAAALFAPDATAAADLISHGAARVYHCALTTDEYEGEQWLAPAARLARELAPAAIWAGHTPAGADFAPRLAFRLGLGSATGCTKVELHEGRLCYTRPCYGGNAREMLSFPAGSVCTIKSGVGTAQPEPARAGDVVAVPADTNVPRVRVIARDRESAAAARLEDAKIIVAGGRGLEGPEGFQVLEELARVLGGVVGASRVPCDLGWCPHSWQIGLTGKTVSPDLYFAVGISGAGHHMAGCGTAKTIVAINTDPDAAIFKEARYGVVGDYRRVLPALISAIDSQRTEEA